MKDLERELKITALEELEDYINGLSDILNGNDAVEIDDSDIDKIFRIAHSVKGGTRAAGFDELAKISHSYESKLSRVKGKQDIYNQKMHELGQCYLDTLAKAQEELGKDLYGSIDIAEFNKLVEDYESKNPLLSGTNSNTQKQETLMQDTLHSVLIIDDQEEVREVIAGYLEEKYKAKFDYDDNGAAALSHVHKKNYDVIICDYKMPILNGTEFIHKLRNSANKNSHTPVIFLSGYKPAIEASSKTWEDVFFVEKPFSAQKLRYYFQCSLNLKED
jgi:CheY-like chemotaxis protein